MFECGAGYEDASPVRSLRIEVRARTQVATQRPITLILRAWCQRVQHIFSRLYPLLRGGCTASYCNPRCFPDSTAECCSAQWCGLSLDHSVDVGLGVKQQLANCCCASTLTE